MTSAPTLSNSCRRRPSPGLDSNQNGALASVVQAMLARNNSDVAKATHRIPRQLPAVGGSHEFDQPG